MQDCSTKVNDEGKETAMKTTTMEKSKSEVIKYVQYWWW